MTFYSCTSFFGKVLSPINFEAGFIPVCDSSPVNSLIDFFPFPVQAKFYFLISIGVGISFLSTWLPHNWPHSLWGRK